MFHFKWPILEMEDDFRYAFVTSDDQPHIVSRHQSETWEWSGATTLCGMVVDVNALARMLTNEVPLCDVCFRMMPREGERVLTH